MERVGEGYREESGGREGKGWKLRGGEGGEG